MVVRKLWRWLKKNSSSVRYYLWGLQSNCCWWSASAALSGKPLGNGTHCGELEAAERSAVNHQRVRYSELLKTTVRSQTHTQDTKRWCDCAPVYTVDCHGHSPDTCGTARNTPLVPERLPGRSAELRLRSGYSQLWDKSREEKFCFSIFFFFYGGHFRKILQNMLNRYFILLLIQTQIETAN